MTDYDDNRKYNNKNRPWIFYANKICSDNTIYSEDNSFSDISGLILEAIQSNIDINTNNGITTFHNDVLFNSSLFISNIYGNIELSGNLTLSGGNINLIGGSINDISYITQTIIQQENIDASSGSFNELSVNKIHINDIVIQKIGGITKLNFF